MLLTMTFARTFAAIAVTLVAACASIPKSAPLPPLSLATPVAPDSAIRLVLAALVAERLPVDGDSLQPGQRGLTSTFRVREGGLGQSIIVFRFRAALDPPEGSRISFDATAEERGRAFAVGIEDARNPRRLNGPHELNPNDREVRQRLARLIDRLANLGLVYSPPR